MSPITIRSFGTRQQERWVSSYRWAAAQPGWVARLAVMAFLLVVALPIALLVSLAVLAGLIVFGCLALVNSAAVRFKRLLRRDARSNVRVIRRVD